MVAVVVAMVAAVVVEAAIIEPAIIKPAIAAVEAPIVKTTIVAAIEQTRSERRVNNPMRAGRVHDHLASKTIAAIGKGVA